MEEEQCREAVLSEDYRDFMLTDRFLPYRREGTYLTQPAGVHYKNVYLPQEEAERFPENMIPYYSCLLYTSPSPRDRTRSRMPSSA